MFCFTLIAREGFFFAPIGKEFQHIHLRVTVRVFFSKLYLFRNTYRLSPFLEVYASDGDYVAVARKKNLHGKRNL